MHKPANLRWPAQRHAATLAATLPPRCIRITVDAASAATLRRVVMRTCPDAVRFLRIDACACTGKVSALLCIAAEMAPTVCQEIARFLPDCECFI